MTIITMFCNGCWYQTVKLTITIMCYDGFVTKIYIMFRNSFLIKNLDMPCFLLVRFLCYINIYICTYIQYLYITQKVPLVALNQNRYFLQPFSYTHALPWFSDWPYYCPTDWVHHFAAHHQSASRDAAPPHLACHPPRA